MLPCIMGTQYACLCIAALVTRHRPRHAYQRAHTNY